MKIKSIALVDLNLRRLLELPDVIDNKNSSDMHCHESGIVVQLRTGEIVSIPHSQAIVVRMNGAHATTNQDGSNHGTVVTKRKPGPKPKAQMPTLQAATKRRGRPPRGQQEAQETVIASA